MDNSDDRREARLRTVVLLPNWVGDSIMSLPVIETLGKTDRQVTILVKPHLECLLEKQPGVDEVIARRPRQDESISMLRQGHFDEALVLPNSFRSAWLAYRAGIPHRWGYYTNTPEGLLRRLLLRPGHSRPNLRSRHQVADYGELVDAMGVVAPEIWTPRLVLSPAQVETGVALLERSHIISGRVPVIGLFAGAEFGPSKRWPWRRFATLSHQLRRVLPGCQQVILAGPKEVWMAVRVHEESGKTHPVIGPDLDLVQLAGVLARLDLLITNDSGPMHISAALGVPCLALFGPTNPIRTAPVGSAHEVLYTDRWCSPCFRRRCPLLHHRCMRDITVEQVAARAAAMLAAT